MSKKYKGKPCIYCLKFKAQTKDHVISKEFFPLDKRGDLPIVPACKACNNEKSKLEHYLTTVLPFGAQHPNAIESLKMTIPRLEKNKKLHKTLRNHITTTHPSISTYKTNKELTLPLDGKKLLDLFKFITKGLVWHHWKISLDSSHHILVAYLTIKVRSVLDPMFDSESDEQNKVQDNLGDGVFIYEGVQNKVNLTLTLWRMSLLHLEVAEDTHITSEHCTKVYCISIPKSMPIADKYEKIFNK